MILKEGRNINMDKEEYYRRIEKINDKFRTDRVSADEEYQLVCQRNYLSTTYIANLEQQVKKQKEVIDKAIDKLYCWGEVLYPDFQKEMLDILKAVSE